MEVLYPTLCELYAAGKLHEFQQALRPTSAKPGSGFGSFQSSSLSNSLSKSPRHSGNHLAAASQHAPPSIVNRRDIKGRTALHLAVSDLKPQAQEYVDALLACPNCQINVQDFESGWTPLHKALYMGNLVAARKLMLRSDCDLRIKDREGLTPFDLLNATIDGTNPESSESSGRKELFTWGSNRNFNLGANVDGDRPLPEKVKLKPRQGAKWSLFPVSASQVVIGRFSTAVLSDESSNNLRICGYGTSGRMGSSGTRITLEPLSDFPHKIKQVALGLDHTVLLTSTGDLFTYGLNHYGQLGYTIEPAPGVKASKTDEPMQLSPRRVLALRKEPVSLIAASRYHTAAYTESGLLYTWGANRGQLGYASDSVQSLPRIVSAVPAPVIQLSASDYATACLLDTGDVFVLFKNTHFKMVFNPSHFPAAMQVYRPPSEVSRLQIHKIAGGGPDWIAISKSGDVFQWTLDDSVTSTTQASRSPVRLWDLRSKFTGVVDAAIHNSSIILCTRSGHVFVGQRKGEAAKGSELKNAIIRKNQWKFTRMPYLQRAVQVATNGAQSFGAIRSDYKLPPISIPPSSLADDLLSILPHWKRSISEEPLVRSTSTVEVNMDDEHTSSAFEQDMQEALRLCRILDSWDDTSSIPEDGTDIGLNFEGISIPTHSCILGARSSVFADVLAGGRSTLQMTNGCISFDKSHPLAGLLLVHYLYGDRFPCLWDPRITLRLRATFPKISIGVVRDELQRLSHLLRLPALARACGAVERIPILPTLSQDIQSLLEHRLALKADTTLQLLDGVASVHSTILRARSPFFAALFGNPVWTQQRRQSSNPIPVDLSHIPSAFMTPVLEHIYSDDENAFFLTHEYDTVDARIDFVASIMATANELLLDRLKIVCAEALRPLVDLRTFAAILQEAHVHECRELADACLTYATANVETMLEGGYLTDLDLSLLKRFQEHIQHRQIERQPFSRSQVRKDRLYQEHEDYIRQLDLAPAPRAQIRRQKLSASPRLSPAAFSSSPHHIHSFAPSPTLLPQARQLKSAAPSPALSAITSADAVAAEDSMFTMDDLDLGPPESSAPVPSSSLKGPVWQRTVSGQSSPDKHGRSTPSFRQIMSDAESSSIKRPTISSEVKSEGSVRAALSTTEQPWRRYGPLTPQKAESLLSIQSQQGVSSPTPTTPSPRMSARTVSVQSPRVLRPTQASSPSHTQVKGDSASGVGAPVISPTRSVSSPSTNHSRRLGQDSAWVNYQSASSFFSPAASSSASGPQDLSFASIQSAQQVEGDALKQKSTRSLGEIQQEEEFERWFAEESKRYQASVELETAVALQSIETAGGSRGGRGGGSRGRGRGRGGSGRGGHGQHSQGSRRGGKKSSDPNKGPSSQHQPKPGGSAAQRQ